MVEEIVEQGPLSPAIGAFESLQSQSNNSLRRPRPPNIFIADQNKVPLRSASRGGRTEKAEKVSKRESKIGLRSFFGRTKSSKIEDGRGLQSPTSPYKEPLKSGVGFKASLAGFGNWPHSRSDLALSSPPPPSLKSPSALGLHRQPSAARAGKLSSNSTSKPLPAVPTLATGHLTASPLFQVYPQAIRHATLPACTASLEVLAKLSASRRNTLEQENMALEAGEKTEERPKRLHQRTGGSRSILDWTTKTYALVTSHYLLQYAADGPFDRLPEKILRLTKDSAAFASDLIPGRHWVLQVVSSMDDQGAPAADSRSFMSKLSLRSSDRKQSPTMLLVFDSAEEMDGWLAVLRAEIEELGGRKQLTETGEAKQVDGNGQLKTKTSQRTIVVRDPERFSTLFQQDFSWSNDRALKDQNRGLPAIPAEISPDFPTDDGSTTESHYSSDGQRLDSLRESNNRLSCISSGQRTYITSADSSPVCSPTRASFSSLAEEQAYTLGHENNSETRLRSNSQAMSSRRQSMQTVMTGLEPCAEIDTRPISSISSSTVNSETQHCSRLSVAIPSNRLSLSPHTATDFLSRELPSPPPVVSAEPDTASKPIRKLPPTALAMSRPLSTVLDLPTPRSPMSPYVSQSFIAPDTPSMFATREQDKIKCLGEGKQISQTDDRKRAKHFSTSHLSAESVTAPRRVISMTSLRSASQDLTSSATEAPTFVPSDSVMGQQAHSALETKANGASPRSFPLVGTQQSSQTSSTTSAERSTVTDGDITDQSHGAPQANDYPISVPQDLTSPELYTQAALDQSLDIGSPVKGLVCQRSMPQLADGPPLAPPPTRALPPIPRKT